MSGAAARDAYVSGSFKLKGNIIKGDIKAGPTDHRHQSVLERPLAAATRRLPEAATRAGP